MTAALAVIGHNISEFIGPSALVDVLEELLHASNTVTKVGN
jgi:hypothetical protein